MENIVRNLYTVSDLPSGHTEYYYANNIDVVFNHIEQILRREGATNFEIETDRTDEYINFNYFKDVGDDNQRHYDVQITLLEPEVLL